MRLLRRIEAAVLVVGVAVGHDSMYAEGDPHPHNRRGRGADTKRASFGAHRHRALPLGTMGGGGVRGHWLGRGRWSGSVASTGWGNGCQRGSRTRALGGLTYASAWRTR